MFGRKHFWGMRRHHIVGAGALASAIGMYSFAARVGLVPYNVSSVVQWITGSNIPPIAGTPFGGSSPPAYSQAASSAYSNPAGGPPAAGYQNIAYPAAGYGAAYGGGDIACYFSPAGGCTEAVVAEIRQARQQILVQAYSFTSVPIANALVEAHSRGVAVYIVLDKSQRTEKYSGADFVANSGIPTLIDAAHAIAHNKIMLIDGQTIITGSFNFTTNAEQHNAENLLVIRNRPDLYQAYQNNFQHHYEHSQAYQSRGTGSQQPTHSYRPTQNYGPTQDGQLTGYPEANPAGGWGDQWSQATPARGPTGNPFSGLPR